MFAKTNTFQTILEKQRDFFNTGATLPVKFRKQALKKLLKAIRVNEQDILGALKTDLGKSEFEAYTNEVGIAYTEIKYALKHLAKWARRKRTYIEFFLLPGKGYVYKAPFGNLLIIAPWNYPFLLLISPLIGAISGGNTALLKPSELTPSVAKVIEKIIKETFSEEYITVIQGGVQETSELLELPFDKIFFTGSVNVGKIVMEAASKNLTPVTLELGGKSPVIVDKSANLKTAAHKIVWGKFNNAGQTCVAPDFVLVDESIKDKLINQMVETVREFYGENPKDSPDYGRIVNKRNVERLKDLIDFNKIVCGGDIDSENRYIAPTVMKDVDWKDKVMQDEIFGPVLPVLTFRTLDEAINRLRQMPKPLALYIFTSKRKNAQRIIREVQFGGGGVNSTVLHTASSHLPFGGVGTSGMGRYHGKAGFDCFTYIKSILKQPAGMDPGFMYPAKHLPLSIVKKIIK
jgi:aldehyde dehydrogenase (NAD+)